MMIDDDDDKKTTEYIANFVKALNKEVPNIDNVIKGKLDPKIIHYVVKLTKN